MTIVRPKLLSAGSHEPGRRHGRARAGRAGRRPCTRRPRARGTSGRRSPADAARGRRRSARPPGRAAGPRCRARRAAGGGRLGVDATRQDHVAVEAEDRVVAEVEGELGVLDALALGRQQLDELRAAVLLGGPKTSTRSGPNCPDTAGVSPGDCVLTCAPSMSSAVRGLRADGGRSGRGTRGWCAPDPEHNRAPPTYPPARRPANRPPSVRWRGMNRSCRPPDDELGQEHPGRRLARAGQDLRRRPRPPGRRRPRCARRRRERGVAELRADDVVEAHH